MHERLYVVMTEFESAERYGAFFEIARDKESGICISMSNWVAGEDIESAVLPGSHGGDVLFGKKVPFEQKGKHVFFKEILQKHSVNIHELVEITLGVDAAEKRAIVPEKAAQSFWDRIDLMCMGVWQQYGLVEVFREDVPTLRIT